MSFLLSDLNPKLVGTNNATGQGDTNQLVFTCPYCMADVKIHCRLGGPAIYPVWGLSIDIEQPGWSGLTVYPHIGDHPVAKNQDSCLVPVMIVNGTLHP